MGAYPARVICPKLATLALIIVALSLIIFNPLETVPVQAQSVPDTAPGLPHSPATDTCDMTIAASDVPGLIAAINTANYNGVADVICLTGSTYTFTTPDNAPNDWEGNALPKIVSKITINGNGATLTRSGDEAFRFFEVSNAGTLTLNDVTLSHGKGAIQVDGVLNLNDSMLEHNVEFGALKQLYDSTVTVSNCTFSNNSAREGGAIHSLGDLYIYDSIFSHNSTTSTSTTYDGGGALYSGYKLIIHNSLFEDNYSGHKNGVIYAWGTDTRISDSTFTNNTGDQAVFVFKATSTAIQDSIFTDNQTTDSGFVLKIGEISSVMSSCIVGNLAASGYVVTIDNRTTMLNNWWGTADGPSGTGPGSGDSIYWTVNPSEYDPFLIAPILGCPVLPPVAEDQDVDVTFETPTDIILTARGGLPPYAFQVDSPPTHGTLSGTAPDLTFTPDPDFNTTDSFTFEVTDDAGGTATGTVNITVVSDVEATDQEIDTVYAPSIPITLSSTGGTQPHTFDSYTQPAHGTITGTAPDLVYEPAPGFKGTDVFTFEVTDSGGFSDVGTVILNLSWDFDAQDQVIETDYAPSIPVTVAASGGLEPHTFGGYSQPSHGTVTGVAPDLVYEPEPGFSGADTFVFQVTDAYGFVETGLVEIIINWDFAVSDLLLTERYATDIPISLADTASGGLEPYTYAIDSQPVHGTATIVDETIHFAPAPGRKGNDRLTYSVTDAYGFEAVGTITVNVTWDLEIVDKEETFAPTESVPVTLEATGGQPPYEYTIYYEPSDGTLVGTGAERTYVADQVGEFWDYFTYTVEDAAGFTAYGSYELIFQSDLTAPDQTVYTQIDTPVDIHIEVSGGTEPYQYYLDDGEIQHGVITGTSPDLTYTPAAGFVGTETFWVFLLDANNYERYVTVTVIVADELNTLDQSFYVTPGEPVDVSLVTSGGVEPYDYVLSTPEHGILEGEAPDLIYTMDAGHTGTDFFTVETSDASGLYTDSAIIRFSSNSDPVVADSLDITTAYETSIMFTIGASGGLPPYDFALVDEPLHGTIAGTMPDLTYTPAAGFWGNDTLTFMVTDDEQMVAYGTVNIEVKPPLVMEDQAVTVYYEVPREITLQASGGITPYTYSYGQPANGTVTGEGTDLTYTPDDGFSGQDSFTVTVTDDLENTVTATITLDVTAPIHIASGDVAGLIAAIENSNANPTDKFTIILAPGTYTPTTFFENNIYFGHIAFPPISGWLEIQGSGEAILNRTTSTRFRFFYVTKEGDLTLKGITLRNGRPEDSSSNLGQGGAIVSQGRLIIEQSSLEENRAYQKGGAIYQFDGYLAVTNTRIVNNTAFQGAIYVNSDGGTLLQDNCISGNSDFTVYTVTSKHRNTISAEQNWWGTTQGPGDTIPSIIIVSDWLSEGILGCPTPNNHILETAYNTSLNFSLSDPPDGLAPYFYDVDSSTARGGSVTGTAPDSLLYTPPSDSNGADHFTYQVTDSNGLSGVGEVEVIEYPALSGDPQTLDTPVATPLNVTLTASGGKEPYTFDIETLPTSGSISGTAPDIVYTPDAGFDGLDNFEFNVTDAFGNTAIGTITIRIQPFTANDQTFETEFATLLELTVTTQGGALPHTLQSFTQPAHGAVFGELPNLTYIPDYNFSGTDTFTFIAVDALGTSDTGTISINVGAKPPATIVVDTTVQERPYLDNGNCTLGEAIMATNTDTAVDGCAAGNPDLDIIEVPAGIYFMGEDTELALPSIGQNNTVIIRGAGLEETVIQQHPLYNGYMSFLYNTGELTVQGITFRNGRPSGNEGAIENGGNLTVTHSKFEGNSTSGDGSAIYSGEYYGENLLLVNNIFAYNRGDQGGAIASRGNGTVTLIHNGFVGNRLYFPGPGDGHSLYSTSPINIIHYNCFQEEGDPLTLYEHPAGYNDLVGNWPDSDNPQPPICDRLLPPTLNIPDGDVTALIEAIEYANIVGHGVIELAPNGTYILTDDYYDSDTGLPIIQSNITINGNGATITRDSTEEFRLMTTSGEYSRDIILNDLTLSNGHATLGGALLVTNGSYLTLNRVTFLNNTSSGPLHVAFGGAIYINEDWSNNVNIVDCWFEDNSSMVGGAVAAFLTLIDQVTIEETIFKNNTALTGNGSSIAIIKANSNDMTIEDNCFIGNPGISVYRDPAFNGATEYPAYHNWWGAEDGPSGMGPGSGDAVGEAILYDPFYTSPEGVCSRLLVVPDQAAGMTVGDPPLNITLNIMGDHQPYTITITEPPQHGTLSGTAPNLVYTPDVGFVGNDSFTFEVTDTMNHTESASVHLTVEAPTILVDSTLQEVPPVDNGNCTLAEAIIAANTDAAVDGCTPGYADDIIELAPTIYTLSQVDNVSERGPTGLPIITDTLTIMGNGATIERSEAPDTPEFRIFHVNDAGTFELDNLTLHNAHLLTGNSYQTKGGGILSLNTALNLQQVTITDSRASGGGGGIYMDSDSWDTYPIPLTITDSNFTSGDDTNSSISTYRTALSISNSTFEIDAGTALMLKRSDIVLDNSTFIDTSALNMDDYAHATITNSQFTGTKRIVHTGTSMPGSAVSIQDSCLTTTEWAALYEQEYWPVIFAPNNWWGSATGPGGDPGGFGAIFYSLSDKHVPDALLPDQYIPFLTEAPPGCITFPVTALESEQSIQFETATLLASLEAIDGVEPYTFAIITPPAHGVIDGTAPDSLTYTPDVDFSGEDSFTFEVTDTDDNTSTATVTLTVTPPLEATDLSLETAYQQPLAGTLEATGGLEPYTFDILTGPAHGTISGTLPVFTYTPDDDFSGEDTFTFEVTDDYGATATGTVTVNVIAPLVAEDQNLQTVQGIAITVTLNASGGTPSYTFGEVADPAHGAVLRTSERNLTYVPLPDFTGTDSFTFNVEDDDGSTTTGTINIDILAETITIPDGDIVALADALGQPGPLFITLASNGSYELGAAEILPEVLGTITLNGNGATLRRTDGALPVLVVAETGDLVVNELLLSGGSPGIQNQGSLLLTNSTLTANITVGNGGALANLGGQATIVNSTLSQNEAASGGGLYNVGGEATFVNATVFGNIAATGGGIVNTDGTVSLSNTIIASNTTDNCTGDITSQGNNLASDDTCQLTGTNDLNSVDPQLGPLADVGGRTPTHAPRSTSVVLDNADNEMCYWADQRGADRPTDGDNDGTSVCDIGAVEREENPPTAPTNLTATFVSMTQVELSWDDAVDDEDKYFVERSVDGADWTVLIPAADDDAETYTDTDFDLCGHSLRYRVRAYRYADDVYSDYSNISTLDMAACTPMLCENLYIQQIELSGPWVQFTVVNNNDRPATISGAGVYFKQWITDQMYLSSARVVGKNSHWNAPGAIDYSTDPPTDYRKSPAYIHDGLATWISGLDDDRVRLPNGASVWQVRFANGPSELKDYGFLTTDFDQTVIELTWSGQTETCDISFDAPLPPTNLAITALTPDEVQLTWDDNATDETAYIIERKLADGDWSLLDDTLPADTTSYADTTVACENNYDYRVRVYRNTDEVYSAYSNTATAEMPGCPMLIESDDPRVLQSGDWSNQSTPQASGESYLYSDDGILTLSFHGTMLDVIYTQDPAFGSFAIEVDNTVLRTVDATGPTTFGLRSTIDYLNDSSHILRVYPVSGTVALDAFEVQKALDTSAPSVPTLIAPGGEILSSSPSFEWSNAEADWYKLYLEQSDTLVHEEWYAASDVCGQSSCIFDNMPALAEGAYTWHVTALNTAGHAKSNTGSFTVSTTPATPTNFQVTTTTETSAQLQWTAAGANATAFYLERSFDGINWHEIAVIDAGSTTYQDTTLYCQETFVYRVRAYREDTDKFSDYSNTTEANTATCTAVPGAVTLVSPAGSVNDASGRITYTWQQNPNTAWYYLAGINSSGQLYLLEWVSAAACDGSLCSYSVDEPLPGGNYAWYVQPYNRAGYGSWGTGLSFNLTAAPPAVVTNRTPANGSTLSNPVVTFTWDHNGDASEYHLYFVGPSGSTPNGYVYVDAMDACDGTTCSTTVTLTKNGLWTWYMVALNPGGYGPWGTPNWGAMTFQLNAPTVGVVQKTQPLNGATLTSGQTSFQWQPDILAVAYETYVAGPAGFVDYQSWQADEICTASLCEVGLLLPANGSYDWYLRGIGHTGAGPWGPDDAGGDYGKATFTVSTALPALINRTGPTSGATVSQLPINFTWTTDPHATSYAIYVTGPQGYIHYITYPASDVCDGASCSLPLMPTHNGSYTWYLQGISAAGGGPWGPDEANDDWGAITFNLNAVAPAADYATLLSPANDALITDGSDTINFEWNRVQNASWYNFILADATGGILESWWLSAEDLGCVQDEICSTELAVGAGSYRWAVRTWSAGSSTIPVYTPGVTPTFSFEKLGL